MYEVQLQSKEMPREEVENYLKQRALWYVQAMDTARRWIATLSQAPDVVEAACQDLRQYVRENQRFILSQTKPLLDHLQALSESWAKNASTAAEIRSLIEELQRSCS